MLGTRIGSYEILEEIGKGGMATVFRARQANVDRDVAIKVIRRGILCCAGALHPFSRSLPQFSLQWLGRGASK